MSAPVRTRVRRPVSRQRIAVRRAVAIAVVIIAFDQLSKALIRSFISPYQTVHLLFGVTFIRIHNSGASFDLMSGHTMAVNVLSLTIMGAVAVYLASQHRRRFTWLGCGLILGGAAGNLLDRLRVGAVTDFIQLPGAPVAFNLADSAVIIGAFTLFLAVATAPLPTSVPMPVSQR